MTDFVTRFVATVPATDGLGGRVMMLPAQGRNTHATPEEAQAWIDSYLKNNPADVLDRFGRDVQVRPCPCFPNHFDPQNIYFDTLSDEEVLARLEAMKT